MGARTPPLGRPAKLSREAIVAAAFESDLRTVTMRNLATRLGVSHSALYRWVADRDQLFDLISEAMVERILPTTEPTTETWRAWLRDLAWKMREEFLAVPGYAAHVAAPHRHNPKTFARLHDQVVNAFVMGGASPRMARPRARGASIRPVSGRTAPWPSHPGARELATR